jgi:hypothetical protein
MNIQMVSLNKRMEAEGCVELIQRSDLFDLQFDES